MTLFRTLPDSEESYLYIFNGMSVFLRRSFYAELHKHHAIQIVLSLENAFTLICNNISQDYEAVVIPPDQMHQIKESDGWHATLHIEPESLVGRNLISYLGLSDDAVSISTEELSAYKLDLQAHLRAPENYLQLENKTTTFIESISKKVILVPIDKRVKRVLELIQQRPIDKNIGETNFSDVPLSKSRLAHLFVEQTGIPISRYILWVKIKIAIDSTLEGYSFTDSAHIAGFSDLSHLSRTFKAMFGSTMSDLFQKKATIRIFHYC